MTERGRARLSRDAAHFALGASSLTWSGDALTIDIDEWAMPLPRRLRGRITVAPEALNTQPFPLDRDGKHAWLPIAPKAAVTLDFAAPRLEWRGPGYVDTNAGDEPLDHAFRSWDWSRAHLSGGTAILYDVEPLSGDRRTIARLFREDATSEGFEPPERMSLPATFWGIHRHVHADPGASPSVIATLENAPFYARSMVSSRLLGKDITVMHESLDLARLNRATTRLMLPFRMPRRAGG